MKRWIGHIAGSPAPLKRLMLLTVLIAFSLQSYVVQTHLHPGSFQVAATQPHHHGASKPLPNDPLNPATCQLCQELMHAGAAIAPAASQVALMLDWAAAALSFGWSPVAATLPQTGWQSRAPPHR